jgi:hypothetical protein
MREPARPRAQPSSFSAGRLLWHVLDNAGVPMLFGKTTYYIDPEIAGKYSIPSPKLPREGILAKELDETTIQTASNPAAPANNASQPMQKIPTSELEGIALPAPRDDVNDKAP